jgi:hypothetical protein
MKSCLYLFLISFFVLNCDSKKTSIAGIVVDKISSAPVADVLVSYVQCKENGEDCAEIIIGQVYTLTDGTFKIDQKRAFKSRKRWITVHRGSKKIGQADNNGLLDKTIKIEITP